jgi:hypothetical protein
VIILSLDLVTDNNEIAISVLKVEKCTHYPVQEVKLLISFDDDDDHLNPEEIHAVLLLLLLLSH